MGQHSRLSTAHYAVISSRYLSTWSNILLSTAIEALRLNEFNQLARESTKDDESLTAIATTAISSLHQKFTTNEYKK